MEQRKLPKSSFIAMAIIVLTAIIYIFVDNFNKEANVKAILERVDFNKIENLNVYSANDIQDNETKRQGTKYAIKFIDLKTNLECKGFVIQIGRDCTKDIDCK